MIKLLVDSSVATREPMYFCVDETSQRRRALAGMMAAVDLDADVKMNETEEEKSYEIEWCVAALEAEHNDLGRAREWLKDRAPAVGEVMGNR